MQNSMRSFPIIDLVDPRYNAISPYQLLLIRVKLKSSQIGFPIDITNYDPAAKYYKQVSNLIPVMLAAESL